MKSPSNSYNFLVADDHSVIREGLSVIIKGLYFNAVIYKAGNFRETLDILKHTEVDLLIFDIKFRDRNSINAIVKIKVTRPDIKILIFSAYDQNMYAIRYLNAGASGYLNKESTEDEIKNAINKMIFSGKYISQNIQDKILDSYISKKVINQLDLLSNREIEVAQLLIKGYGNLEILALLDLKKTTISTYKRKIFEKLEIDNLPDLIKFFQLYYDEYPDFV